MNKLYVFDGTVEILLNGSIKVFEDVGKPPVRVVKVNDQLIESPVYDLQQGYGLKDEGFELRITVTSPNLLGRNPVEEES